MSAYPKPKQKNDFTGVRVNRKGKVTKYKKLYW